MTPREKAKQLLDKVDFETDVISVSEVRELCLIVADAVIEELNLYSDIKSTLFIYDEPNSVISRLVYWEEVKIEINRL